MDRSHRELGYEAVSTRDEDATQSEVLIWLHEALDVDSSGYAMKVAGIAAHFVCSRTMCSLSRFAREAPSHCDEVIAV